MSNYSDVSSKSSRPDPGDTQSEFRGPPTRTSNPSAIVRILRSSVRKRTVSIAGLTKELAKV